MKKLKNLNRILELMLENLEPGIITADKILATGPFSELISKKAPQRIFLGLAGVLRATEFKNSAHLNVFGNEFYISDKNGVVLSSAMGAPSMAFLVEILIAWGVREVILVGLAGYFPEGGLSAGDIVIADHAISDEGTSQHYGYVRGSPILSMDKFSEDIKEELSSNSLDVLAVTCVTTDAIFRETPSKIESYMRQGAEVIDMETAALFNLCAAYKVKATSLLVLSDEVSHLGWRPGFTNPKIKESKKALTKWVSKKLLECL
jgi:purine-nucleoside phosphorylase